MNNFVVSQLVDLFKSIAVCGIPVAIVWIVMSARRKTMKMKYDIILKSIDSGVQVDPEKLLASGSRSLRKLKWGIVESAIGLPVFVLGLLLCCKVNPTKVKMAADTDPESAVAAILLLVGVVVVGIILLAFGVANIVSTSADKKNDSSNSLTE